MSNEKGTIAKLANGTPVVDINIRKSKESGGVKQQKIHFIKEEKN